MAKWVEKGSLQGPPGEIPDVSDFLRDGDVSSAISGSSDKVASDKAVKDYVDSVNSALDGKISAEATARQEQDEVLLGQISGKANVEHSHEINDVTGLNEKIIQIESDIDNKADAVHTHDMSAVNGLDGALGSKADSVHTHAINDVTGLRDEIDGKSAISHTHVSSDVTDLQGKLDAKSNTGHTHEIVNVTGLQNALDGKAALAHAHEMSDITGLDSKISEIEGDVAGKADSAHTHDAADVVSGTLAVDRIPSIPDSKIENVSASKLVGVIPTGNLPSYVDDVIEADDYDSLPPTGEAGKIYVDKETNKTYRWGGSAYVEISASLALGETSATAFRGDYGKTAYDHAQAKGSEFATGFYKITTNAEGHVTSATAVNKGDITALGVPAQDTTYVDATGSASGLMSSADKTKLDGIANGANNYTHPTSAAGALGSNIYKITTDADGHVTAATPVSKGDITALGIPSEDTDTTYTAGSGLTLSGTEFGIADGGIIGKHLDDNCVMERNIAVGSVTSDKIPALAITTPKLADNAVTTIKMADDAVATRSIQDGAVTAGKIAAGVIPDVSGFITSEEASGAYAAKSHTHDDRYYTETEVDGLLDGKADVGSVTLASLGVTATAEELNYMDGVTSNVQTQLNGKAASSHNHSAANITSGTLAVAQGGTGVTTEDALVQKIFNSASTPKASATQYGVVKFASDADFKAYMGIS